jgi:hypothetical protein
MNSLHKAEVCPWEIDMRELAGGFARVITRPPTPPQKDATSGKDKYVEVILHEDGRKMRLPELAIRLSKSKACNSLSSYFRTECAAY